MENTELLTPETAQAMYEIAGIVITLVISMVGVYIRNFLQTNKKAIEYNLNNDRTERILANALAWAEAKSLEYVDSKLNKTQLAKKYVEDIAPDIVKKEGTKLDLMLERKDKQLSK